MTMVTSPLPRTASASPIAALFERGRVLAFVAPLTLFAHGIVVWLGGLGAPAPDADGVRSLATTDAPDVVTGLTLVAVMAVGCWLTAALGSRLEHLDLAPAATLVSAFGTGATGAVWLGTTTGVLDPALPTALTVGGPLLVALGLAAVLVALTVEGRMPVGSAALAGAAGVVLALPWGLVPLGALLLLLALGPPTRPAGVGSAADIAVPTR